MKPLLATRGTIFITALLLTALAVSAADVERKKKGKRAQAAQTGDASIQRDIPYSTNGGVTLKLDIYSPKTKGDKPAPAAVYIHGGGWRNGNKSSGGWITDVTSELVGRGYVVVAVDYRLAPDAKWPAYIHDVKAAVRFVRAHAAEYHVDPSRIGAWGSSAGGHLVALLGTADAGAKLEGDGGWADQSSRVQAVVDLFGPSDLAKMMRDSQRAGSVFGDKPETLKEASPVTYVSKDDAPFLILQGDADKTVPPEQSQILHDRLVAAGVSSTLVMVKNGGHGLGGSGIVPARTELVKMIGDFFDTHLRKP
jgi:acetyl esterase/lipase